MLKAACRCRPLTTGVQHCMRMTNHRMCRDANLLRSKISRLSILHYIPPIPPNVNSPTTPPPAHKLTQPPRFRTLCEVLHEVHAIKICLHHYNYEIIFAGEYVKKCPRNCTMNKKRFEFWGKKWAKFRTKAQKSILSGRFGDPYGRVGDQYRNRESTIVNFTFLQNSFRTCERHFLSNNQCLFRWTVSATVKFDTSCIHVDQSWHMKIICTLWFFTFGGCLGLLDKFSNLSFSTNGRANESCKYHENNTRQLTTNLMLQTNNAHLRNY